MFFLPWLLSENHNHGIYKWWHLPLRTLRVCPLVHACARTRLDRPLGGERRSARTHQHVRARASNTLYHRNIYRESGIGDRCMPQLSRYLETNSRLSFHPVYGPTLVKINNSIIPPRTHFSPFIYCMHITMEEGFFQQNCAVDQNEIPVCALCW